MVLLLIVLGVFELSSLLAYLVSTGEMFSFSGIQERRSAIAQGAAEAEEGQTAQSDYAIHPYLGYVYDPQIWQNKPGHDGMPVSDFGFIDNKRPVLKRSEETLIVGIFGGSVAWWLSQWGETALVSGLRSHPEYRKKEIQIIRLGLGGYKQPQQLMTLSYLLCRYKILYLREIVVTFSR